MPASLEKVLTRIQEGKPPRVLLVGGSSDFLSEKAFHEIRDAIVAQNPSISVDAYEPATELAAILDSYRTMSLFGGSRLLIVPEVNAFVSAKEIASLYDKAVADWKSAKTDRKRASAAAKLLHVLGLAGSDLEMKDRAIADNLGVTLDATLTDMLAFCRNTGKKAGRGEDDAALLMEAIARGGAPGTILLMRTGEVPRDSATIDLIDKHGAVVVADLTREGFVSALEQAIASIAAEANVRFDPPAIARLRQRLGFDRILADKFSKEIPELRGALNEVERLVTLAGSGGRVTPDLIDREVAAIEGGARYELGSLFTEGKILEAIAKLRDLVAQGRREDSKMPVDMQYGRFLFPLAEEIRQMIGIHSWARVHNVNLRQSMHYNRFKDTVADRLGDYLKAHGLVRQRPHPFPLHKKYEAAGKTSEAELFRALAAVADMEVKRKSGGLPVDVGMETFLLSRLRER
ncbi:MAG: DNA polymerase III subunit delta [Thermoanaerobaculia bacterium]